MIIISSLIPTFVPPKMVEKYLLKNSSQQDFFPLRNRPKSDLNMIIITQQLFLNIYNSSCIRIGYKYKGFGIIFLMRSFYRVVRIAMFSVERFTSHVPASCLLCLCFDDCIILVWVLVEFSISSVYGPCLFVVSNAF